MLMYIGIVTAFVEKKRTTKTIKTFTNNKITKKNVDNLRFYKKLSI